MNKSVLVTGESGQLGQSIRKIKGEYSDCEFTFVGRNELDLSCKESILGFFIDKKFDVIINCAAYTSVDKAEVEAELADQINHLAVKQLAEIAKENNTVLIHISTDYVFDGTNYKPYVETDKACPINTYGLTKLKGEQAIQNVNPKGAIIRTSWVYSEFGNNFVKTMLKLGEERDSLSVICDQVGSPTYATDLAKACLALVDKIYSSDKKMKTEVYNYSNEGVCSWYDFAQAVFEISDITCELRSIETKDYPTPAKRPHYSVMSKNKIKKDILLGLFHWRHSLSNMLMIEIMRRDMF